MKTVNIKGKEYVEVNERLKYFRNEPKFKDYSLESEVISLQNGIITIKAIIKDGNGVIKATGLAQEKESSSFINKTSFVENCETSAWGRALGNLGIGIDTSVASAEEVENAIYNQPKASKPLNEKDIDIIEGLKGMDCKENAHKYFKTYEKEVENVAQFKKEYAAIYTKLPKLEELQAPKEIG
jgi:hypothetical protein